MRSLFWLLVGAGLTVFMILRGRELMHKLTPRGFAEQVDKKGHEVAVSFGDFMATYRAARDARETELREGLGLERPTA